LRTTRARCRTGGGLCRTRTRTQHQATTQQHALAQKTTSIHIHDKDSI
jgi:hypothetical protein